MEKKITLLDAAITISAFARMYERTPEECLEQVKCAAEVDGIDFDKKVLERIGEMVNGD